MSTQDRMQKVSAAVALAIIAGIGVLVVYGVTSSYVDGRTKKKQMAERLAEIERIEASAGDPASKSKAVIEIAYSTWDTAEAVDAKYPEHLTLNRVGEHVQQGYQQTAPLSPGVFTKAATATCLNRVRQVSETSPSFPTDNLDAYHNARNDLEAWRQYLSDADFNTVWGDCRYRFQFMQARYDKAHKPTETVTLRDVGEQVGKATAEVGKWWDETTKPVTDAVDEFKAGYQSGKN